MKSKIAELEREIEQLKQRNQRVEADKAWEISNTRKLLIAVFTYAAIALYLWAIGVAVPWLHAIVPTVGFLLSTLTMSFFKQEWLRRMKKV